MTLHETEALTERESSRQIATASRKAGALPPAATMKYEESMEARVGIKPTNKGLQTPLRIGTCS